ncbi:MAG: hypothetical protein HY521_06680 [Proteobacteria bacterium]|nr:hypothetical protein [Pseudomonadota bacterium]
MLSPTLSALRRWRRIAPVCPLLAAMASVSMSRVRQSRPGRAHTVAKQNSWVTSKNMFMKSSPAYFACQASMLAGPMSRRRISRPFLASALIGRRAGRARDRGAVDRIGVPFA